jgi:hypothetical protein
MDTRLQAIAAELHRIEENARYSAQSQFEQAKYWRGINLAFGIPTSILAALAGGTGLASVNLRIFAAWLALAAAGAWRSHDYHQCRTQNGAISRRG